MDVRDTLLLACGTANTRGALHSIFEDTYNLLETDNYQQTMLFLKQNKRCIAAVLLDITQKEQSAISVLADMGMHSMLEDIPVIIITDENSPQSVVLAYEQGAADVVFSSYNPLILQHRVQNLIDLYRHKWHLEDVVEEQEQLLRHSNDTMVDALSSIIEYRSVESGQHILRIRRFTKILLEEIARNCPEYKLTDQTIQIISSASALHDVGKIAIPDAILNKPGKLTADEWATMRSHTLSGCHIIETLNDIGNPEYVRYAHNICHYHHERWNGGGYPEGIAGDDIPICAQVVGLADVYDALTTKRVYKDAIPHGQAVNMILNGECGAFSPKLLECFKQVSDKFEALAKDYADGMSPKNENFDVSLPAPDYHSGLDSLQHTQSKYLTLLHHVDGTAIEVDLDQGVYHAVYSPHLELAPLCSSSSFEDAKKALYSVVIPEEHDRVNAFLYEDIPTFFNNGNRRQVFYFHVFSSDRAQANLYQVTLLRPDLTYSVRRMVILWQRGMDADAPSPTIASFQASASLLPNDAVQGLLTDMFRYRNDRWFTLEGSASKFSSLLGYTDEDLIERFQNRLIELVVPEDREMVRDVISKQLSSSPSIALGFRLRHRNGQSIWVLNKSHLVVEPDGNEYLYGTLTDITYSQTVQQELLMNLERYQTILAQTESIIFEWSPDTDQAYFSKQWEDFFGYEPLKENVLQNLPTASHFHPEDLSSVIQMFHDMKYGSLDYKVLEVRIANDQGRYHWCRLRMTAVRDERGDLMKMVGILLHIDEEKQATIALQEQASRDTLTGLLNKQTARRQIEHYLSKYPPGASCALFILDLDNFKHINDHFGHMFGDMVLTQVAREIRSLFRSQDIVARIGGDEFLVLMQGISDRSLIENRCATLLSTIQNLFHLQLHDQPISCSIGIALAPQDGTSYVELFERADMALYQTKKQGKNGFSFY